MKKYAIFGNPVEHSISPLIHNAAFKGLGINAEYSKILLKNGDTLKNRFLTENLCGANITVPHKEYAYAACDKLDKFAKKIGAVNTIVSKNGKLHGYNTDAPGFLKSLEGYKNINKVLILGAGGTAKAISTILKTNNYAVSIINRTEQRLASFKKAKFKCYTFETPPKEDDNFDLIINTTSAGLDNSELPAPAAILNKLIDKSTICIDVIYGKETPFLMLASKYGKPTKDGLEMLLHQGVIAFMHFTDDAYDYKLVESYMREAIKEYTKSPSYYSYGERDSLRKTLITTICQDMKDYSRTHSIIANQCDKIGLFYIEGGNKYAKSLFYFNKALKIRKKLYSSDAVVLSSSYENLAILFRLEGKYQESEIYYKKALTIINKNDNTDTSFKKNLKNQLGILYKEMGRLSESHLLIQEVAETCDDDIYMKAINYNNLASLKKSEGDYMEAIKLYSKALKLQKKLDNNETPHTASIYDNLAYVYKKLANYKEALILYNKALEIREEILGKEHITTAITYYNIATVYMNFGNYTHAETYYLKALTIQKSVHGLQHPEIASLYESLGILYIQQSTILTDTYKNKSKELLQKGKKFLLDSLAMRHKLLKEDHLDIASGYYSLGSYFYKYEQDLDEALKYYTKSLLIRKKIFTSEIHPDIATNYYNISLLYIQKKSCLNALKYAEKAIFITEKLNYIHPLKHHFLKNVKDIVQIIKKAKKLNYKKKSKICSDV
ncbi:MAG TPA: shikimate dehydrogenase [Sulfurimonas autotrophica]|nr:shikimate dehydrogenase [Sulfurimonas autotrophica]